MHPQHVGRAFGTADPAVGGLEYAFNMAAHGLVHGHAVAGGIQGQCWISCLRVPDDLVELQRSPAVLYQGALHRIFKFTHIPGPGVPDQLPERILGDDRRWMDAELL